MFYNVPLIRSLRQQKGVSVTTMSQLLGYVEGDETYYHFEREKAAIPITRSGLIVHILGCQIFELFILEKCKRLNLKSSKPKKRKYKGAYKGEIHFERAI
ncbi:hypothetical protein [Bacillus cereus]|uniref:Uncharacterized protein n=1 Tax=Bacillus cereus VD184 TaxID=1053242 RepID=A0A9W5RB88_BACCE|nr:hypothetical protein [Bacillus cereus]EOQ18618.1 hypothetical protein IKC_05119 [Bacillus cereus VD184]